MMRALNPDSKTTWSVPLTSFSLLMAQTTIGTCGYARTPSNIGPHDQHARHGRILPHESEIDR
jgi:hypothetical protein